MTAIIIPFAAPKATATKYCSFCKCSEHHVKKLIGGDCVAKATEMMGQVTHDAAPESTGGTPK